VTTRWRAKDPDTTKVSIEKEVTEENTPRRRKQEKNQKQSKSILDDVTRRYEEKTGESVILTDLYRIGDREGIAGISGKTERKLKIFLYFYQLHYSLL
jgi:hypothetical protein